MSCTPRRTFHERAKTNIADLVYEARVSRESTILVTSIPQWFQL